MPSRIGPEIDAEVQSTLAEFFAKVGFARALANRSVAILVFPTVLKAGFGIGGEYGKGRCKFAARRPATTTSFRARSAFSSARRRAR